MINLSKKNKQIISMVILILMMLNSFVSIASAIELDEFVYEDEEKTIIKNYRGGREVEVPEGVKIIRRGAFKDKNIKNLKLNEGLEVIENEAFSNNQIEGEIVLPSTINKLESFAFADNKIKSVDFSKIKDVDFGESVFQDNEISGELDLRNLKTVPMRMFMNNKISNIIFSNDLAEIGVEAFLNNKLAELNIKSPSVHIKRDAFASNGQYVQIYANNILDENSTNHSYGHIVNPVNIIVRSLTKDYNGSVKQIKSDKIVEFNPYESDNFFALNQESYYVADFIENYTLDRRKHDSYSVYFTPDKDNYVVEIFYEKVSDPIIKLNKSKLQNLIKNKKEGSDISKQELLSLVSANDFYGTDISNNIVVHPESIINLKSDVYDVVYTVKDNKNRTKSLSVSLPIDIDPLKIKIGGTEWQLEDFKYGMYGGSNYVVSGLSDLGKEKAKTVDGIAVPHINPYTMDKITEVNFRQGASYRSILKDYIKPGQLVFGDPEAIRYINLYSFYEIPIEGDFPYMPDLIEVGERVFYKTNMSGQINAPKLKKINDRAFTHSNITDLVDLSSVEYIGDWAFYGTQISGQLPDMPNLKHIGNSAFEDAKISGKLPDMPELEYIGDWAFTGAGISGLSNVLNLKHIGDWAFYQSKISGGLPQMPALTYIGKEAFMETGISKDVPNLPNLEYVGDSAFEGTNISGILTADKLKYVHHGAFYNTKIRELAPEFPNLEYIGIQAFTGTYYRSPLQGNFPDMPKLEHIGDSAFRETRLSNMPTILPKLKTIERKAFEDSTIGGKFPDAPNLEFIEYRAFHQTNIRGQLPEMPNLKSVENSAFYKTQISGHLPKMPKLEHLGHSAFRRTAIGGKLPEMPNLKLIEDFVFYHTNISKEDVFMINNDIEINEGAFRMGYNDNDKMILKTYNGEGAPLVSESNNHILNPYLINIKAVDKYGRRIKEDISSYARSEGDKLRIRLPKIQGYISEEEVLISKSDLSYDTYTHRYQSYKDYMTDMGGNKYQFKYNAKTKEGIYDTGTIINTSISLSTVNENMIEDGSIRIFYDEGYFRNFVVGSNEMISNTVYGHGEVIVYLKRDIMPGTELNIPVTFQINDSYINSFSTYNDITAVLYNDSDGNDIVGADSLSYGVRSVDPSYKSVFDNEDSIYYKNLIVPDLSDDYDFNINLNPKTENLYGVFDKVKIVYDPIYYYDKNGTKLQAQVANPEAGWIQDDNSIIYQVENVTGRIKVPRLNLKFENPRETEGSIKIKSSFNIEYRNAYGFLKRKTMSHTNELNIFPEERYGNELSKSIREPHFNGRHSYFYDNLRERSLDFKWKLLYRTTSNVKSLTITDYDLDYRMQYKGVIPNGNKVVIDLYDKNDNNIKTITTDSKYIIEEDLRDKVKKISMSYYNLLANNAEVEPIVITEIKNPKLNIYQEGNDENVNRLSNRMSVRTVLNNGQVLIANDHAFTNVVADNKSLASNVKIVSPPSEISYGKTSTSRFGLISKDFFNMNVDNLKYTALVNPGQRVESVLINRNIIGTYDISKTSNGYTKIDFNFTDLDIHIDPNKSFTLFELKTSPEDRSVRSLDIYGLLHDSSLYDIYNNGDKKLEDIDTSEYSYSNDNAEILRGEYFTIQKLIGKDNDIGKRIETNKGEEFFYRIEIENSTKVKRTNFELIDILPFKGDFNSSQYSNKLNLNKKINVPEGFKIEYLNQNDNIEVKKTNIIESLSDANWSNSPADNTKAIKITAKEIPSSEKISQIDIPMITNNDLKESDNGLETISQFAYRHDTLGYKQALSNTVAQMANVPVPKRDIKLRKVSTAMGEIDGVIEGVKFVLKDSYGMMIKNRYTNKDGELVFENIPAGNYRVEEVDTPKGYKENKQIINIKTEDMLKSNNVLDLGDVINERIDEFDYLLKNVELMDNLNNINYSKLGGIYSREISDSNFEIINRHTGEKIIAQIRNRSGVKVTLNPGVYILKQTYTPKDNGLYYKENNIEYMFEIDKFGKVNVSTGKGDNLENKVSLGSKIIYFPNTIDYKTSTVNINKIDKDNKPLPDAEFTLINVGTGEKMVKTTTADGLIEFKDITPGLYSLRETKAPAGYITSEQVEIIEVPFDESKDFSFDFINRKIQVNVNKFKIVADNIKSERIAKDIASKTTSSTNGKIIIKYIRGIYQVREVWENNNININNKNFVTNSNGSILNIEEDLNIKSDTIININNSDTIKGHYEDRSITAYVEDYIHVEGFDGTINIDIEVKPLKGTIYVSKYAIDENNKEEIKEEILTNGAEYTLFVDKGTGNYEELETKEIDNSNYLVFKDLDPNYKYKVKEIYVPEGQEESAKKEIDVDLNELNRYTASVVFRNYIPLGEGQVNVVKIDGDTDEPLDLVEFTIQDRNGVTVQTKKTNSNGELVFDELEYDLAPYTIIETETKNGYRLNTKPIEVTEEDLDNQTEFTVKNFKKSKTPETGTLGKLPFVVVSLVVITAGVFLLSKKKLK